MSDFPSELWYAEMIKVLSEGCFGSPAPAEYLKSVNWVLCSLNLMSCHVVVRKRGKLSGQTETLGGGSVATVISRYGSMTVESTDVIDNILYLYVK